MGLGGQQLGRTAGVEMVEAIVDNEPAEPVGEERDIVEPDPARDRRFTREYGAVRSNSPRLGKSQASQHREYAYHPSGFESAGMR